MSETKTQIAPVQEVDRETHMHPFTSAAEHAEGVPKLMVEGSGIHVRDEAGNGLRRSPTRRRRCGASASSP